MSGVCDTCRRTTCEYRADDIALCALPKTETNWERLFGTPERAARTLENGTPLCNWCDTQACDKKGGECPLLDYNALLEWLRGDAE